MSTSLLAATMELRVGLRVGIYANESTSERRDLPQTQYQFNAHVNRNKRFTTTVPARSMYR